MRGVVVAVALIGTLFLATPVQAESWTAADGGVFRMTFPECMYGLETAVGGVSMVRDAGGWTVVALTLANPYCLPWDIVDVDGTVVAAETFDGWTVDAIEGCVNGHLGGTLCFWDAAPTSTQGLTHLDAWLCMPAYFSSCTQAELLVTIV